MTLRRGRAWYVTEDGVPQNVDGEVETRSGRRWLWDYTVHAASGAQLHAGHAAVLEKRWPRRALTDCSVCWPTT